MAVLMHSTSLFPYLDIVLEALVLGFDNIACKVSLQVHNFLDYALCNLYVEAGSSDLGEWYEQSRTPGLTLDRQQLMLCHRL